jgi:hypothetical protein
VQGPGKTTEAATEGLDETVMAAVEHAPALVSAARPSTTKCRAASGRGDSVDAKRIAER